MWVVRLTDKQLEVLRALAQEHLRTALQRLRSRSTWRRWDKAGLLPSSKVTDAAKRQDESPRRSVVWDMCGSRSEPAAPTVRRRAAPQGQGGGAQRARLTRSAIP